MRRPLSRGLALVAVLWIVAALSVLVLSISGSSRHATQWLTQSVEGAKIDAALAGALELAAARAAYYGGATRAGGWSVPLETVVGEGSLRDLGVDADRGVLLTMRPAGGLVDLNLASAKLLAAILLGVGLDEAQAEATALAVVAQRERSLEERLRDDRPGGPFRVPEDLMQVEGVGRNLYRRIEPWVTVYGAERVNPFAAPASLLQALTGADYPRLRDLLDQTLAELPGFDQPDSLALVPTLPADVPMPQWFAVSASAVFHLEAEWRAEADRIGRGGGDGEPAVDSGTEMTVYRRGAWVETGRSDVWGRPWVVLRRSPLQVLIVEAPS